MPRISVKRQLQVLADSLQTEDHYEFEIVYRGLRSGYWAIPDEPRWYGDEGSYLGDDLKSASRTLRAML